MIEFQWAGETLSVLGERALWWPRRRTLCVADVHLGKAAAFRRAGVPVPESTTEGTLRRLTALIERWWPVRLVILGDLLHCSSGRVPETMGAFEAWREVYTDMDVLLIRGNHDARAGDPPETWKMRVADGPFADSEDGQIVFAHEPETPAGSARVLCGHIHPAVELRGPIHGCRAACFWFSERIGVLPAFGAFTGMKVVLPSRQDTVFAVRETEIVDVSMTPCSRE